MSSTLGQYDSANSGGVGLVVAPAWERLAALGCLIAVLFALASGIWGLSLVEDFGGVAEEVESRVSDGSAGRRVAYLALGALGVAGLLAGGAPLWPRGALAVAGIGLAGWAVASAVWSIDPGLTVRRLFVFGMCGLAALAAARRYTARELVTIALFAAGAHLTLDVLAALAHGTFRPWQFGYRFAGTLHPNHEAGLAAIVVLAGAGLAWRTSGSQALLVLAAFLAGGLLFLTKSRTNLAALVFPLGMLAFFVSPWRLRLLALLGLGIVAPVAAVFLDAGDALGSLERLLGRADTAEVGSLTGRLPLWQELLPSILARPLTGYGFGAFWSPERILALADSQGWTISHAHSDYLDLLLALGLPGLLAYATTLATGVGTALHRAAQGDGDAGAYLAIAGWLVFLGVGGLTEQVGLQPSLPVFCALCGLVHLACRRNELPALRCQGGLHP